MGQIHLRVVGNFCKQNNITAAHFLFAKRFHSPKTDRKFRSPDVVLGDLRGFTGFIDFLTLLPSYVFVDNSHCDKSGLRLIFIRTK